MGTSLDHVFMWIMRVGALLSLLGVLVPGGPEAQAGWINPAGRVTAPQAQADIVGPVGSGSFGSSVTVLPNGNFVVADPTYSGPGPVANVGAVYLYNGATLTLISTLKGSTANDLVGSDGVTALANGGYVVNSPYWYNGGAANAGAVTWCSGTAGCAGTVSPANSLVGSTADDYVGNGGVTALTNGSYVVSSERWDNSTAVDAGAATWCSGTAGCVGAVSSANSLVGSKADDLVGFAVTALTNGSYAVSSPWWGNGADADAGAATWCGGTAGCVGVVSPANSLVGSTMDDRVGYAVRALTNGSYVVISQNWDSTAISDAGAATWCSGTAGCTGAVSSTNSLVGSTMDDRVGYAVRALTNGSYVVISQNWDSTAISDAGAATWCSGTAGCTGAVSSTNSLVGSAAYDRVGLVTALSNGSYVVGSQAWDNGSILQAGAATWCSGTTGCTGTVTPANSLVGSTAYDYVGYAVTALTNGNYVASSMTWSFAGTNGVGAATWCGGTAGCVGAVTPANSLVGSTEGENVGASVTALTNGSYVVGSPSWDNGAVIHAGAATWCSGTTGCKGAVTPANSLIGSLSYDAVGSGGVTALTNGRYVVSSPSWSNSGSAKAGAATWCGGAAGCVGAVSSANSLVGSTADDMVGSFGVTALTSGSYVVLSPSWDNAAILDAGAVTLGAGGGATVGPISAANSVRGTAAGGGQFLVFAYHRVRQQLIVGRPASSIVSVFACPFCSAMYIPLVMR